MRSLWALSTVLRLRRHIHSHHLFRPNTNRIGKSSLGPLLRRNDVHAFRYCPVSQQTLKLVRTRRIKARARVGVFAEWRLAMADRKPKSRWVAKVKTDSTHPPAGLFNKRASTIARTLASPKVSPKGPGSGMRMLTYFINRAGRGLSASRRAELERAKSLLSKRVQRARKDRKRTLTH